MGPPMWLCLPGFLLLQADPSPPAPVDHLVAQANDEFEAAQRILGEQPDRAKQLFRSAAHRFEAVAKSGIENGKLEYNIGNAYLQSGDIGRAILHYRRAERLIPNDALLADNLSLARSKRLTAITPTARSELVRTLFFWHYDTTVAQRAIAALALYVLFWLLLGFRAFKRIRGVTIAAFACLALGATAAASAGAAWWSDARAPAGVVLALDVPVYKGPGAIYQRQFLQPLQPGVEFNLEEQRGEWWRIELPDGKTGWIEANTAELVPASGGLQLIADS